MIASGPRADHQEVARTRAGCIVEAAARIPGPLRAFFERVRSRRGMQRDRPQTHLPGWHLATKGEDYAFARPSLTKKKLRRLELRAGAPSHRRRKGTTGAYSLKEVRAG